jgi:hypothetical protein
MSRSHFLFRDVPIDAWVDRYEKTHQDPNNRVFTRLAFPTDYGVESPRRSNASAPATSNGRTHSNPSAIATETKMRQNMG